MVHRKAYDQFTQNGDDSFLVSVADMGIGLQPEHVEQIFRPFFTSKSQGTGMGLPISRSIIESQGGRLWATASRGQVRHFSSSYRSKSRALSHTASAFANMRQPSVSFSCRLRHRFPLLSLSQFMSFWRAGREIPELLHFSD